MYDRLPTPFGLVRGGVAPDHDKIKSVTRVYDKTADHPDFRFYGNVEFGRHLDHDDLRDLYHAVVYATAPAGPAASGSRGRTSPAASRRPRSSAGTTATPTSRGASST